MILCEQDACDTCRVSDATCGKLRELQDDWKHYVSRFTD
jgi:hypothetical protein